MIRVLMVSMVFAVLAVASCWPLIEGAFDWWQERQARPRRRREPWWWAR